MEEGEERACRSWPAPAHEHQRELYRWSPFGWLLGMELGLLAPGRAEVWLKAHEDFCNPYGTIHGGVLATLVDSALGQAVLSVAGAGSSVVTVELKLNYLAPARVGLLVARGEVIQQTGTLAVAQARVYDADERGLVIGLGTYRIFRPKVSEEV